MKRKNKGFSSSRTLRKKQKYSLEEVFQYIPEEGLARVKVLIDGDEVNIKPFHLRIFRDKKPICPICGCKGLYFYKEKEKGSGVKSWVFKLYGFDKEGQEVLFTLDHIFPKSLGGTDTYDNLQPMCYTCNSHKADKVY